MASRPKVFSMPDAWIFASLNGEDSKKGVELHMMIMSADVLNHSIPTSNEVVHALSLLHKHGLVEVEGKIIRVTSHGKAVYDNGRARRGGLFSIVSNMHKALNSPRIKHPIVSTQIDLSFITDESMQEAYQQYRNNFEAS